MAQLQMMNLHGNAIPNLERGIAIGAYCFLETTLCRLFAHLLGTDVETAGIVFFRVINTRSRNTILDKLMIRKGTEEFLAYWNSVLKEVRKLDTRRNEIAHWHPITFIEGDWTVGDKSVGEIKLLPPAGWDPEKTDNLSIDATDLREFSLTCDDISRAINILATVMSGDLKEAAPDAHASWTEICRQPLPYPLPDSHLLSRNYKAPETPPQSSEV